MDKNWKYKLMKFKDVPDDMKVCADHDLSEADMLSYIVALNLGMVGEDIVSFYYTDSYPYFSKDSYVIAKVG